MKKNLLIVMVALTISLSVGLIANAKKTHPQAVKIHPIRKTARHLKVADGASSSTIAFDWGAIPAPVQNVVYSPVTVDATNNDDGTATIIRTISRTISYATVVQVLSVVETDYAPTVMSLSQSETEYAP